GGSGGWGGVRERWGVPSRPGSCASLRPRVCLPGGQRGGGQEFWEAGTFEGPRRCYLLLLPRPRPRGSIPPPPLSKAATFHVLSFRGGSDARSAHAGNVADPPRRGVA